MYLTRLLLNPRHPQVRKDLSVRYDLHRTLAKVFPGPRATDEQKTPEDYELRHGMLYRVEEPGTQGVPVLVQSATEPEWNALSEGYALRIEGPKPVDLNLEKGQQLRFRFVANPTLRKTPPGKKNGRRVPLIHSGPNAAGHPTYFEWLDRQAERCGFAVLDVQDAPFRLAPSRRKKDDYQKRDLPLFGVRFDGVLTVTDPKALTAAVRNGIGPAKAFGFGLLSLAPA